MLPFSSEATFVFQASAFFAFCGFWFWCARRSSWYGLIPVIIVGVFAVVHLSGSKGGYEGLGRLALVVFAGILLGTSGTWTAFSVFIAERRGWFTQAGTKAALLPLMILAPAIAASGAAAIYQYTPPSDCTQNRIVITIGTHTYALEKDYHAMVRLPKTSETTDRQFAYTPLPADKLDVRDFCRRVQGETQPIVVEDLWVRPENIISGTALDWRDMENLKIVKRDNYFSEAYGSTRQFIASISEIKDREDILMAKGNSYDGQLCRKNPHRRSGDHYCLVWRSADADTIIVGTKYQTGAQSPPQTLSQLNRDIDGAMAKLLQE